MCIKPIVPRLSKSDSTNKKHKVIAAETSKSDSTNTKHKVIPAETTIQLFSFE